MSAQVLTAGVPANVHPVVRQLFHSLARIKTEMFGARALLSYVHARFASGGTDQSYDHEDFALQMAALTTAIHGREVRGQETTLRQLHQIAELPQPTALTLIDRLEQAEIVCIDRNIADAFESTITLSNATRRRLDRAAEGKAA